MAKRQSTFEQGKPGLPPSINIECWLAGGLISNIRRLARLAEKTSDELDKGCLVLSAFLNAGAALEAILHEYAYKSNPPLYGQKRFLQMGVEGKYETLKTYPIEPTNPPLLLAADFPDIIKVLDARHALSHNEPDRTRSRFVGEVMNVKGAYWAFNSVLSFAEAIWGGNLPPEIANGVGND